jgi:hypothetical protein
MGDPISCHGAPPTSACAAFIKESRMEFANAIKVYRKSGAQPLSTLLLHNQKAFPMTTPYKRTDPPFVIPSGGMGLRPTYEDENGFGSATSLPEPPPSPLSSRVIMGQRPTQCDEKSLRPATTLYRTVALSFVIPTRISCHVASDTVACAPFF